MTASCGIQEMRTHPPSAPVRPTAPTEVYARGMRIFNITKKSVRADSIGPAAAGIDTEPLTAQFTEMLGQPAAFAGFVGRRIRLDGMPPFTIDWLTLRGRDCFATFACDLPPVTDYLLVMTRPLRGRNDANLRWFMERVIGGFGPQLDDDSVRLIREWPAPAALRFSLNPRPADQINLVQRCFCDAFARVINDS